MNHLKLVGAALVYALTVALAASTAARCEAQTRLVIVRHAAVTYDMANPQLRHGRQDPPVNPEGREQAKRLAELARAEGVTHIYHSPLRRGRETAAIVGRILKLRPVAVPGFAELHLGDLEDKDRSQKPYQDQLSELFADLTKKRPGGESFTEMQARATAALRQILARHPRGTVLIIGHGVMNRTLVGHLRGLALRDAAALPTQSFTSAYVVTWNGKPPAEVTSKEF